MSTTGSKKRELSADNMVIHHPAAIMQPPVSNTPSNLSATPESKRRRVAGAAGNGTEQRPENQVPAVNMNIGSPTAIAQPRVSDMPSTESRTPEPPALNMNMASPAAITHPRVLDMSTFGLQESELSGVTMTPNQKWLRDAVTAVLHGHDDAVRRNMESNGLGLNAVDDLHRTQLYKAAISGNMADVRLCLEYPDSAHFDRWVGDIQKALPEIPLEYTRKVANSMIPRVDLDIQASDGSSALMVAVLYQHYEIAELLVHSRASPICLSLDDHTPLSVAIDYGVGSKDAAALALKMFSIPSFGERLLRLEREGDVTLWEACDWAREDNPEFFAALSERIAQLQALAITLGDKACTNWNETFLMTLLLQADDPRVADNKVPNEVRETRKCLEMIPFTDSKFRAQYMLLENVGTGAFSSAWKTFDMHKQRVVAVKFLMETSHGAIDQIKKEARFMKSLGHKNVMDYHELLSSSCGGHIMVTEFAEGGDLQKYLRGFESGRLQEIQVKTIFRQIMEGLSHMHSRNVVHRDLKTANILVFSNHRVKIADFGNSCKLPSNSDGKLNNYPCTPLYRSPESILSKISESHPSFSAKPCDIWSAGIILHELLVNKLPFRGTNSDSNGNNWKDLYGQILEGDLKFDDDRIWGNISTISMTLLGRMLHADPTRRPTAEQVLMHPWFTEDFKRYPLLELISPRLPHHERKKVFTPELPEWMRPISPPPHLPPIKELLQDMENDDWNTITLPVLVDKGPST
ncbi:hypothetical protein VTL71DRAFT_13200 [Oculimacula yallundae]|uniref:Protein kinase domain-containing protein n=1 Tax=Oculimacula yallundae TaxID=86028 RepID=A0ABR4CLZ4_9HELO